MKLVFQFILIILSIPFLLLLGLLVLGGIAQNLPTFAAGLGTGMGGALTFLVLRQRYCQQKGIQHEFDSIDTASTRRSHDV